MLLICSFLALTERDWIVRDEYSCHIDRCHIVIGPLTTRGAAWVETIARLCTAHSVGTRVEGKSKSQGPLVLYHLHFLFIPPTLHDVMTSSHVLKFYWAYTRSPNIFFY